MGVISGVGVREEPSVDGYLRGQIWNRPAPEPGEWILFRLQHYDRFAAPFSFVGADLINQSAAPAPLYNSSGIALDVADPALPFPFVGAVYQGARVYIQGLGLDIEGSPRLYPPPAERIDVPWVFKEAADRLLNQNDSSVRLNNGVLGFKLKDLTDTLAEEECRIVFSSRVYGITSPVAREGNALVPAYQYSMQYAEEFIAAYEEEELTYLDVIEEDRLVDNANSARVRLFAAAPAISLQATGTEFISSFILNIRDRALSRSEIVLVKPSDSMPIPPPSWGGVYTESFEVLV